MLSAWPVLQKNRNSGRNQRNADHHGREQRNHHRRRHGMKHFALDAGEAEDRDIHQSDNGDPEEARLNHLAGGGIHQLKSLLQIKR